MVKKSDVEVKPFILDDFTQDKEQPMVNDGSIKKVTKKALKSLADEIGLTYADADIDFTKKLMTAYMKKIGKRD